MNKERVLQLADYIEALPEEKFDMAIWCGTACCMAGHAKRLFKARPRSTDELHGEERDVSGRVFFPAQRALGLSVEDADILFLGMWSKNGVCASKSEAVAHLRSLAAQTEAA